MRYTAWSISQECDEPQTSCAQYSQSCSTQVLCDSACRIGVRSREYRGTAIRRIFFVVHSSGLCFVRGFIDSDHDSPDDGWGDPLTPSVELRLGRWPIRKRPMTLDTRTQVRRTIRDNCS